MAKVSDQLDPQRKLLEALVVDNRDLDRLEDRLDEFNLFEAIGATRVELRHSEFLRFLLEPSENHGLGDYFLKMLLKHCLAGTAGPEVSAIDVDVADLSDAVVERERWGIDVLVHSERCRMVFAIENKIDSYEHDDQLNRYRETIEREFAGYRKVLIYLTPEGEEPSDAERWLAMSYATLATTICSTLEARSNTLNSAVTTTLEHYAAMIGRHIVSESEIAKLCRQIYRQHKDALDLIFEHKPDRQLDLKEVLEKEIAGHSDYVPDHCTKTRVRFVHDSWDRDPRQHAGSGWNPTKRVVAFELANDVESLRLKLIIGPVDKSDAIGIAFREAVFACSQKHRHDFPGGMTTLAPRFTTILARELVKKKDYETPESVPDKAREALRKAFEHDLPEVVKRLSEVFNPG